MIEPHDEDRDLKLAIIREKCEADHLFFTRYFFKARNGFKFKVNWHHHVFARAVERVMNGQTKNLLINVPPGSSKTEEVVINFIARGVALNKYARFLHLSYSETLAALNSQTARDIVQSDEFQELWPTEVSNDDRAKSRWNIIDDKGNKAGGCYAVALGGQVTGFRAGRMVEGFQGAILIDDPLKPEDAYSKPKREHANQILQTTVKSRKANPETPIVVIMQRLAENDPTGFIKAGNLKEVGEWEVITIPALIDEAYIQENALTFLSPDIIAMIDGEDQDESGRFSYWPYKEPLKTLLEMEQGSHKDKDGARTSKLVFAGQYMQAPKPIGGNLIKGEWFKRYTHLPLIKERCIFADTAQKTKEHNDFSVFQCWGLGIDGNIYLLDQIRGKWEAPELKSRAIAFWEKHKNLNWEHHQFGPLRKMYVEDKSSGTGLIQQLAKPDRNENRQPIPIEGIQRNIDKLSRVIDAITYIEPGMVFVPEAAEFTNDFVSECEGFNATMTHDHDDQIDPMVDAIDKMLSNKNKLKQWENLI
jgi:predicted phage terminase large subunit-like protein